MIDEEKFHHAFATILRKGRVRANAHPVSDVLRAGNLRARHPVDDRFAVRSELGFAIGPHLRQAHFDQTHPTIARRAELLVVAIPRHITAGPFTGFDHAGSFRELVPHAVDLDVHHLLRCKCFRHSSVFLALTLALAPDPKRRRWSKSKSTSKSKRI